MTFRGIGGGASFEKDDRRDTSKSGFFAQAKVIGVQGMSTAGNMIDGVSKAVQQKRGGIVDATRKALEATGKGVETAGQGLTGLCNQITEKRSPNPTRNTPKTTLSSLAGMTADFAIGGGAMLGRTVNRLGTATYRSSSAVGEMTGSLVVGTVNSVSGVVDAVAIRQEDFDDLERRLLIAGQAARQRSTAELASIEAARRSGSRGRLMDLLVIGGVTVADISNGASQVPVEVERAFELAYPGLAASGETFSNAVDRIPTEDLVGLVSGVKGKLFEIGLVDQMNAGQLVEGLHAEIAQSATQPGYDIIIHDDHGAVMDVLQAKATASVDYVREALERYPNIDVVTTSEVHGQLLAMGLGDRVSDSGITEVALQQKVEMAAGIGDHMELGDFVPSALGVALIAFSAFTTKDMTKEERFAMFGDRTAKAGMAGAVAKTALVVTGTWWIALAGGIGFRMIGTRGDAKRQRLDALKHIVESLEADNSRRANQFNPS